MTLAMHIGLVASAIAIAVMVFGGYGYGGKR